MLHRVGEVLRALAVQAVNVQDFRPRVDGAHLHFKHLAFRLRDDVALGDNDLVRKAQHRPDFRRGADAAELVDDAYRHNAADMRRTAVAKPCAFRNQIIEPAAFAPCVSVLNVADEKVIGTQFA